MSIILWWNSFNDSLIHKFYHYVDSFVSQDGKNILDIVHWN